MGTTGNVTENVGDRNTQRSMLTEIVEAVENGFGVDNPINILSLYSCEELPSFQVKDNDIEIVRNNKQKKRLDKKQTN